MKTLLLFDVDGTLTPPRNKIKNEMAKVIRELYDTQKYDIGFVGGSDRPKQIEQLGETVLSYFKWQFSENGLDTYLNNKPYHSKNIIDEIGEAEYCDLVNKLLMILSMTRTPVKRGTFIELRNGVINVSPVGRSCSQKEREEFEEFDKQEKVREQVIDNLKQITNNEKLKFSIGGQISFDITLKDWDKTYCLQFLEDYDEIHFFGDKVQEGENDYELFIDGRVISYKVDSYKDTINILKKNFY